MEKTLENNSKAKKIFKGYLEILQFLFSSKPIKYFLSAPISENSMFIILGLIGVARNIMNYYTTVREHYFSLRPAIVLSMFFFPIFLCFFGTVLLYFLSNKLGLKVKIKQILSVLFFIQIVHLIIPFIDALAPLCENISFLNFKCIPTIFNSTYIDKSRYLKLIFSPLAFTPFILFYTRDACLSYVIAWFFAGFVLVKLYLRHFKFPAVKSLIALCITFYVLYLSTYSSYYFFVTRESKDLFLYALFFMLMSVLSVIYVKILKKK